MQPERRRRNRTTGRGGCGRGTHLGGVRTGTRGVNSRNDVIVRHAVGQSRVGESSGRRCRDLNPGSTAHHRAADVVGGRSGTGGPAQHHLGIAGGGLQPERRRRHLSGAAGGACSRHGRRKLGRWIACSAPCERQCEQPAAQAADLPTGRRSQHCDCSHVAPFSFPLCTVDKC